MAPFNQYILSLYKEFHRANLFSVSFQPPFFPLAEIDDSSILVRTSQMPGMTINTLTTIYNNRKQNFAVSTDLDPVTMDIFCDSSNDAHSFIVEWGRKAIQPDTRVMSYKRSYAGTVEIDIHTKPLLSLGISSAKATLINAFPVNITPVELSQENLNTIAQFSCSFIFDEVIYEFSGGLLDSLLSFGVGALATSGDSISLL